jgi:hypothetical protein
MSQITISENEYKELLKAKITLDCLRELGITSWDKYQEAVRNATDRQNNNQRLLLG